MDSLGAGQVLALVNHTQFGAAKSQTLSVFWLNLVVRQLGFMTFGPKGDQPIPGRTDPAMTGTDSNVYHRTRIGLNWSPWEKIGGASCFGTNPAMCLTITNHTRLDLVTLSQQGRLWHKYNDGSGWVPAQETWHILTGVAPVGTSPALVSLAAGTLELITFGTDGLIYSSHYDGKNWSAWLQHNGGWNR